MSTTTIRLSDELKARVTEAARRAGTTAHGFILEAIAEKTALDERHADFRVEAENRYARIVDTGESIDWDDMRNYLKAKASNKDVSLPKSRKFVR